MLNRFRIEVLHEPFAGFLSLNSFFEQTRFKKGGVILYGIIPGKKHKIQLLEGDMCGLTVNFHPRTGGDRYWSLVSLTSLPLETFAQSP